MKFNFGADLYRSKEIRCVCYNGDIEEVIISDDYYNLEVMHLLNFVCLERECRMQVLILNTDSTEYKEYSADFVQVHFRSGKLMLRIIGYIGEDKVKMCDTQWLNPYDTKFKIIHLKEK